MFVFIMCPYSAAFSQQTFSFVIARKAHFNIYDGSFPLRLSLNNTIIIILLYILSLHAQYQDTEAVLGIFNWGGPGVLRDV